MLIERHQCGHIAMPSATDMQKIVVHLQMMSRLMSDRNGARPPASNPDVGVLSSKRLNLPCVNQVAEMPHFKVSVEAAA
jgi:hypothetical protein